MLHSLNPLAFRDRARALARLAPEARALAWQATDAPADRLHVARQMRAVPWALQVPAVRAWARQYEREGYQAANLALLDLGDSFASSGLDLTASDDEIKALAKRRARDVRGHLLDYSAAVDADAVRVRLEKLARTSGVQPPDAKTLQGLVARMACERWWTRALRRGLLRTMEAHAIRLGFVHRRAALYASHEAVARRGAQRRRNARALDAMVAVNETGQEFTLSELARGNVSNPAIRRAELMTRIRGFEEFAQARGDAALFITATCPSRMHARHASSGQENEKYDGTTPRQAQEYLTRTWAKTRAALKRAGVWVYGFRIVEPHHDGTPHWHLLLFMRPDYAAGALKVMGGYFSETDSAELSSEAARTARFAHTAIDWTRGSAAGYVAKYVAKNIDGHSVGVDFEAVGAGADGAGGGASADASATVARVDAWASTWGIRQFQQVGGPGVTIWRELRRLRGPQQLPLFDDLRTAADVGLWRDYTRRMGGIETMRRDRTLNLWRVDLGAVNRYGEDAPAAVEGVAHFCEEVMRTRFQRWEISTGGTHDGRTGRAVGAGGGGGVQFGGGGGAGVVVRGQGEVGSAAPDAVAFGVPWTRVNNCTQVAESTVCGDFSEWVADYDRAERQHGVGAGGKTGDGGRGGTRRPPGRAAAGLRNGAAPAR
jgi:hypothetical protein